MIRTRFLFFFFIAVCSLASKQALADEPIDRHALVSRHNIVVHELDPNGAMAVGNGEFAFNFDVTGLQSFSEYYSKTMPIGILSNWGWHSFPNPNGYSLDKFPLTTIDKHDRKFVYPASSTSNPQPEAAYLRGNPHRFGLGRIGLEMTKNDGTSVAITDLKNIDEQIDLWTGVATSTFDIEGSQVHVVTAVHPTRDEVAIAIESPLIAAGRLKIRIAFPYTLYSFGPDYQDWTKPDAHQTLLIPRGKNGADFERTLDDTHYFVRTAWSDGAKLSETATHQYLLSGPADRLEFTAWFSSQPIHEVADTPAQVQAVSQKHWQNYWSTGGAIDLSGNDDPRAAELERRIVLSQYVMAVHDSGSLPPQETGLAANSWFGKFHMEMYWWHAAHWTLWGRPEILEKSFSHLHQMMPPGQEMAKREGCVGVKWSKMTDPSGSESPSSIGPVLVWQQPHPIYLAELLWRAHPNRSTLERYQDIVFQTADYMASFVDYDSQRKQYVLGPAVAPADEKHPDYAHNLNPTMELGYWKWALETAQQWRVRLGMPREEHWDKVIHNLAPLPVRDGIYPALELPEEHNASRMATWLYGVLPGQDIDRDVMRNTLHAVTDGARWRPGEDQTWGTAMVAMCAARLNEPETAIDLLVGEGGEKSFRPSGYAVRRPQQTPMYMPANGGWLAAVAMMAAGWDGNSEHALGFPKNWKVRYEGLQPMP
jgi:protein-glucosylgalactosylhydroxylysine glucosidase